MHISENFISPDYSSIKEITPTESEVVIQPLERGYGHTLGNALRRVLLASVPGAAVVSVSMQDVLHEYSVIEGVYEDVIDIFLNLKQVAVKLYEGESAELIIDCKGPRTVTAGDIQLPHNVEIMNKDLVIATVSSNRDFYMKIGVEKGFGYSSSAEHKARKEPQVGTLFLDSFFTPVRRVSYHVDNTRLGDRTDLDKLKIELETNGTISPTEAINFSATILHKQLSSFVDLKDIEEQKSKENVFSNEIFSRPIEDLELTIRSINCLHSVGVTLIGELVQKRVDELMQITNFGKKSLTEVEASLYANSLQLGINIES